MKNTKEAPSHADPYAPPAGIGAFNANQKAPPLEPITRVRKRPPAPERETRPDRSTPPAAPPELPTSPPAVTPDEIIRQAIADTGGTLSLENVRALITRECRELEELLIRKNRSYGNSALEPVRIFSKASVVEQLKVRLDDKLSRIQKGTTEMNEDTLQDIQGYIVLLRIALRLGLT